MAGAENTAVLVGPDEVTAGQGTQGGVDPCPAVPARLIDGVGGRRHGRDQFGRGTAVEHGDRLDGRPLHRAERRQFVEEDRHRSGAGRPAVPAAGVGEGAEVERVAAAGRVELPDRVRRHPGGKAPGAVVRCQRSDVQPGEGAGVGGPGEAGGEGGGV